LGEIRREALEKLTLLRGEERVCAEVDFGFESTAPAKRTSKFLGMFEHISQLPDDLSGLSAVAVPIEENFEELSLSLPLYVTLPRGIASEEFLKKRLSVAKKAGITAAFCGNIAEATICKEAGIKPYFGFSMNIYNSQSARAAKMLGAGLVTISPEARCDMLSKIDSPLPTAFLAYGRLPLMLMRNCPQKNGDGCKNCRGEITDRKGISFPLRCRGGYTELLNSRPTYLAERIDEFSADYAILYFTTEEKEECAEIINRYEKKLPPDTDYTRGLYYRGVE
jgi:putative protease